LSLHPDIVAKVVADIEDAGALVRRDPLNDLLTINEEFCVSVVIVRCQTTAAGSLRWKVRLDSGLRPNITIAARMGSDNVNIRDYYLLPWIPSCALTSIAPAPKKRWCASHRPIPRRID
jgi:hypothetical protein